MGECRLMVTLACHGPFRGHLLCECRLVVTLATQSPRGTVWLPHLGAPYSTLSTHKLGLEKASSREKPLSDFISHPRN